MHQLGGFMQDDSSAQRAGSTPSSVELLGMIGFGLQLGWMFVVHFWLFDDGATSVLTPARPLVQLCIFAGNALGLVGLSLVCRKTRFSPFSPSIYAAEAIAALLLPVISMLPLAYSTGLGVALCVFGFLAGVSTGFVTVAWLDICSRLHTRLYGRFIGAAFLIGSIAFVLAAIMPHPADAVLAIAYILASIALVMFTTGKAAGNAERVPITSLSKLWRFQREVEPSLFVFGITFGMTFAWLFTAGEQAVFIGLCCVIPGALCITLLSLFNVRVDITMVLRILLCLCVFACVFMPHVDYAGRLLCSCIIVAAWTTFTALNFAFIVRKNVIMRECPCFRVAPLHLSVPAAGFAVGWLVIYLGTLAFGVGAEQLGTIRLACAVLLVVVFMMFFPSQAHHSMDGNPVNSSGLDEKENFHLQIRGVAKHHGLSPRETEILRFLAKGRNAGYICEKLVVSPHTVRSHMYNIYKKLDVHSQQEVIDLVEGFPVNTQDFT